MDQMSRFPCTACRVHLHKSVAFAKVLEVIELDPAAEDGLGLVEQLTGRALEAVG
jgi:hypothetical protein